jgi:hypothetical protein
MEQQNAFVRGNDEYDTNDYIMRLARLLRNESLPDVFSTPIQSGRVGEQFMTTNYTSSAPEQNFNEKGASGLGLMGAYPITDNISVGSSAIKQQDGSTVLQPSLFAAFGPFQATAGYRGVLPADSRAPTTFAPNYGVNVNTPLGDGFLMGSIDKTAGQRDPLLSASYSRPFMGGSLGLDVGTDTKLKNLSVMLGYRKAF